MTLREYKLGSTVANKLKSWNAKIEKNDLRKPNMLKFSTTLNSGVVDGDECKYYDLEENYVFGGFIKKINSKDSIMNLEVADYYITASEIKVNEVYESLTVEAMLTDLINEYTDWTIDSLPTTNITISKIIFRDTWLIDCFNKLLELINGGIQVDKNKQVKVFIDGGISSGKTLEYGKDVIDGGWIIDGTSKAEKVIVRGAFIDQRTTETIVGTGTEFFTSYTPENVQITELQQTTSNIEGDYVVDTTNKKITFNTSQTDPVVSYTYNSQVRVEIGIGKTIMLEKKYLETRSEARRIAREYKARFKDGSVSAKWVKNSSDINSYEVGSTIQVIDLKNNRSGVYSINKIVLNMPNSLILEIGNSHVDLFDQNKEIIERIKQLEELNNNQDFITLDEFILTNINVGVISEITSLTGIINDGKILWASETELASGGDLIYNDVEVGVEVEVGWWTGDGNTNDRSGNTTPGTWIGNINYGTGFIWDNNFVFDEPSKIVTGLTDNVWTHNGFIISGWIKYNSIDEDGSIIIDKSDGSEAENGFMVFLGTEDNLNEDINLNTGDVLDEDTLYFVSVVVQKGSPNAIVTFFIDGEISGNAKQDTTIQLEDLTTTMPLTIAGKSQYSFMDYVGEMGDMRVYGLDGTETDAKIQEYVTSLYNEGLGTQQNIVEAIYTPPLAYDEESVPESKKINYLL